MNINRTVLICFAWAALAAPKETALDRYLRKPDPSFGWELTATLPGKGVTGYQVDLTSQTWRKPEEVNHTVWKHWLIVARPDQVKSNIALLFIDGGSLRRKPPGLDTRLAEIARSAGAVVAQLRMVPNEPLLFAGEDRPRTEDEIIAYTWDKFLRGGDEEWPLRLPMTKAAHRAMDAVTALLADPRQGGLKVDRFVVAGGSKRGWTTWTTGATDKRVVAIAPIVIHCLNVEPSFRHHFRAYGFWAPAVKEYEEMNIFRWLGHPRMKKLLEIEDPWEYRDRLAMPKFIMNSAGDQFFVPDSSQFYFEGLKGEKHVRYVPNSDHSLDGTDAFQSLAAFFESVVNGRPRPRFDWQFEKDGSIRVKAVDQPAEGKLWQATNADKRDFRKDTIGNAWRSSPLAGKSGVYVARVEKPAKGWTGFFVELTYSSGGKIPHKLTTGVRVVPDVLPSSPPDAAPTVSGP